MSGDPAPAPFDAYADEIVGRAADAATAFRRLDQQAVDRLVEAVFRATFDARIELARLAFEETGMGVLEHKVQKNAWASLVVHEQIRHQRTVGVLADDPLRGITEIARPLGPVLAITPITNPTSTVIFKALIALKTRNPLVYSFHRGARRSCREAARIARDAAVAAGAPADCIQWIAKAPIEYLDAVMQHRRLALILATGAPGIVRRAQRSGTPTLGAGPGNVPVYVHRSADLGEAARLIAHSKTFDNGTVCASEQALVVEPDVDAAIRPLLAGRGAHFCSAAQTAALGPVCYDDTTRTMRAEVVGRPAADIAARAGFTVPPGTRLLVAEPGGIGAGHPLSHEILAPVLAYYPVPDYEAALAACRAITRLGGVGHTVSVHAEDEAVVSDFAAMDAGRILVNAPATEGALGGTYTLLPPSLTLGCGPAAGNATADNITIDHLIEIHRVARLRPNEAWLGTARETWLDPQVDAGRILDLYRGNRRE
jgi:acetaldehyde dehydrogenase / alcohol dehydrogenase